MPRPPNAPFSHQGEMPLWTEVSAERMREAPYAGICEIVIDGQRRGTGWLAGNGLVVTAAHVVQSASGCDLRFAGSSTAIASLAIHRLRLFDDAVEGSEADMACIVCPPSGAPPLAMALDAGLSAVTAIGYAGRTGPLVEHSAGARLFQKDFIAHFAHTGTGHSGCPLLAGGMVVGLHLGDSLISQPHIAAVHRDEFSTFLNVALALTPPRLVFIRTLEGA